MTVTEAEGEKRILANFNLILESAARMTGRFICAHMQAYISDYSRCGIQGLLIVGDLA